ncbi:D-glycerate dehydrogenase, partial [Acidobacteriia bacterium AH_259_A11_L15]|nr:D-glycerate dehydrogenase [Acidobacteriia bacterium AH_259_A11_L15]
IGQRVARRARGFGMRVLYHDTARASASLERELGVEWAERERLLRESDFVTLHVPLLPETHHLMGTAEFGLMKPTAYLINASRGPVVDEAALAEALERKQIAGAGLDVFENEPRVHPKLLARPNVLLAPHLASASVETRTAMAVLAAENVVEMLEGRRPPHLVNPEVYEKQPSYAKASEGKPAGRKSSG